MARRKRGFGTLRRLPSKNWQAYYTGPDKRMHYAPATFVSAEDGEAWLANERRLISTGEWTPPKVRQEIASRRVEATFGAYAERWLRERELRPRTRSSYRSILDRMLLPAFGATPLVSITSEMVRDWWADRDRTKQTMWAHAYGLLRTILGTAVDEERIPSNPARIRGAGSTKRAHKIEPASLEEVAAIAAHMPEGKYRTMVWVAALAGLRFGELTELRRKDLDLRNGVIHVRRAVVRVDGGYVVGPPKSEAGVRDVAIPSALVGMLKDYRDSMPMRGQDALLFPARDGVSHMAPATLYKVFYRAREKAGRKDLRWHDLRHTSAVLAAQTGATIAELMARLGHSSPQAAIRYQHAARGRDAEIARRLGELASGVLA